MIYCYHGDITSLSYDCIVNAANERMLGGGGVDGAIHRAAGPALLQACLDVPEVEAGVRCPTGDVVHTVAGGLFAKGVIHTVAPIYSSDPDTAPDLLRACYRRSLKMADNYGYRSIAFPSLGTGAYGYPICSASEIALTTAKEFKGTFVEDIVFVTFLPVDKECYTDQYHMLIDADIDPYD